MRLGFRRVSPGSFLMRELGLGTTLKHPERFDDFDKGHTL